MKFSYLTSIGFALILLSFFLLDSDKQSDSFMTIKGEVMGTTYKVILKGAELQTYDKQINNIFEQVNQEMSTYLDT